jgi:hypothetical protein
LTFWILSCSPTADDLTNVPWFIPNWS